MSLKTKTLEDAKQYWNNARDIKDGNFSVLGALMNTAKQKHLSIEQDRRLSEHGKQIQKEEYGKEFSDELLGVIHNRKQQYDAELSKAYHIAQRLTYQKPQKPHPDELSRFEHDYKRLKQNIEFETSGERAFRSLKGFIEKHDNFYYKTVFSNDFSGLIDSVKSIEGKLPYAISTDIRTLLDDLEPTEVTEARELYEDVGERLNDSKFTLNPAMEQDPNFSLGFRFREYIGDNTKFLDNTEEYFLENPDEEPEKYIDAELETQRKLDEASEVERKRNAEINAILGRGGDQ
ncbi:hypothetical protein ACE1TF_11995 [Geomicrobium sp. JSM 1781026]|uniref:hypothetical protein n=1 Tax=Geomicrobium sp. JSM 1781026 TaxID=3344580 RepID=UPI0035BFC8DF